LPTQVRKSPIGPRHWVLRTCRPTDGPRWVACRLVVQHREQTTVPCRNRPLLAALTHPPALPPVPCDAACWSIWCFIQVRSVVTLTGAPRVFPARRLHADFRVLGSAQRQARRHRLPPEVRDVASRVPLYVPLPGPPCAARRRAANLLLTAVVCVWRGSGLAAACTAQVNRRSVRSAREPSANRGMVCGPSANGQRSSLGRAAHLGLWAARSAVGAARGWSQVASWRGGGLCSRSTCSGGRSRWPAQPGSRCALPSAGAGSAVLPVPPATAVPAVAAARPHVHAATTAGFSRPARSVGQAGFSFSPGDRADPRVATAHGATRELRPTGRK
jgi:hypothetical protein